MDQSKVEKWKCIGLFGESLQNLCPQRKFDASQPFRQKYCTLQWRDQLRLRQGYITSTLPQGPQYYQYQYWCGITSRRVLAPPGARERRLRLICHRIMGPESPACSIAVLSPALSLRSPEFGKLPPSCLQSCPQVVSIVVPKLSPKLSSTLSLRSLQSLVVSRHLLAFQNGLGGSPGSVGGQHALAKTLPLKHKMYLYFMFVFRTLYLYRDLEG